MFTSIMARSDWCAIGGIACRWGERFVHCFMVGVLCALNAASATAQTVRLAGAGDALGTMTRLDEAYRKVDPSFALVVIPNFGSEGALRALRAKVIDIAAIDRPLTKDEESIGLRAIEYGRTPFVLVTNRHDISGVSLADASAMVSGQVVSWPDGAPIRIVLRPKHDRDTALLAAFSPAMRDAVQRAHARPGMMIATTDQESATEIEHRSGSFGTATLALILSEHRHLQSLAIDGVVPTVKELASGRYLYSKVMYLVMSTDSPVSARRFVAFVQSPRASATLNRTGHWVTKEQHAVGAR
jgi:phosphate transport system substrate-binding protein